MATDETQQPVAITKPAKSWGTPFVKGERREGQGRPKGRLADATIEVKAAARNLVDDPEYRESLRKRLHAGLAPHMETLLWHYAYGKPKETIEVEGTVTVEKIVREVIDVIPQHEQLDAVH